jgi:hypothetical protein
MTSQDLNNKLYDLPFQPFRVRLTNNTTIDILNPGTVVVGPTTAIMPIEATFDKGGYPVVNRWLTVALDQIVELTDIEVKKGGTKKR